MRRRLSVNLTLFGLLASPLLFGSNYHDHLFSVPFATNIAALFEQIFSLPEEQQRCLDFFDSEEDFHAFLRAKWGETAAFTGESTIAHICRAMPGDPQQNLEKLLSCDFSPNNPIHFRQQQYMVSEKLRKAILLALSTDDFEEVFRRYFESEPIANRRFISASVTQRFFKANQKGKYKRLAQLANAYGTKLVFRVSLQRQEMLEGGLALPEEILDLLRKREISSIDVVGSLQEASYVYDNHDLYLRHMTQVLDFSSDNHLALVFHLFEKRNSGIFYECLEKVLREYPKELYLEIGHIAALNDHWLEVFSSNPHLHVLFHANLASNQQLHDVPIEQLRQTIQKVRDKNFKIVLGSDGRGILPFSSYQEQQNLMDFFFDDESFCSIFF